MRPSIASLLRWAYYRGTRLLVSSPYPGLIRWYQGSPSPAKHVKIDDEEQLHDDDYHFLLFHKSSRSSPRRIAKAFLISIIVFLVLIFLIAYIIYKPPTFVINVFQWKYPDVLFHVPLPSSQRVVALTLDDAPSSETATILDLLKAYGAKATFFIIGSQISAHPELLHRMHDEGHEIGNHAWADEPSLTLPLAELERQIKEVEGMLPPNDDGAKYFRPGSGFFNKKMVERVKNMGYRLVLGNIFPHDPQIHVAWINARHVLSMVRPGGIIILHDRRSYSAEQLELVLKGLAAREWKVESVGGLLAAAEHAKRKKGG